MDAVIHLIELSGAGAAVADSRLQQELRAASQQLSSRPECRQAVEQYQAMSEHDRAQLHSENIERLNRAEEAHLASVQQLRAAASGMRESFEAWQRLARALPPERKSTASAAASVVRRRVRSQPGLEEAAAAAGGGDTAAKAAAEAADRTDAASMASDP